MESKINCSSCSSIKPALCLDHFYLVSIETDPQDPVWFETFYGFLQIYHSYYNKKLKLDKLASFMLAYKRAWLYLPVSFENMPSKVFFIVTLNTKNVPTSFGAKNIQKTKNSKNIFCANQPAQ